MPHEPITAHDGTASQAVTVQVPVVRAEMALPLAPIADGAGACGVGTAEDTKGSRAGGLGAGRGLVLPDAGQMCHKIIDAMGGSGQSIAFDQPLIALLQKAWAVAEYRNNAVLAVEHIGYVLVFEHVELAERLAHLLGTSPQNLKTGFALGCITRMPARNDGKIVAPSVGAVRWLKAAHRVTRMRGESAPIWIEDLVAAVEQKRIEPSERQALRRAGVVGAASPLSVETLPVSAGEADDEISPLLGPLERIEQGQVGTVSLSVEQQLSDLQRMADGLVQSLDDQRDDVQRAQGEIKTLLQQVLDARLPAPGAAGADLETLRAHVDAAGQHTLDRLGALELSVRKAIDALPAEPKPAGRVGMAIALTLFAGIATGLALTAHHPGSPVAQVLASIGR